MEFAPRCGGLGGGPSPLVRELDNVVPVRMVRLGLNNILKN